MVGVWSGGSLVKDRFGIEKMIRPGARGPVDSGM